MMHSGLALLLLMCGPIGLLPFNVFKLFDKTFVLSVLQCIGIAAAYFWYDGNWWNIIWLFASYHFVCWLLLRTRFYPPVRSNTSKTVFESILSALPGASVVFVLSFPLTCVIRVITDLLWSNKIELHFSWSFTLWQSLISWAILLFMGLWIHFLHSKSSQQQDFLQSAKGFVSTSVLILVASQVYIGLWLAPERQTLSAGIFPGWFTTFRHSIFFAFFFYSIPLLCMLWTSSALYIRGMFKSILALLLFSLSIIFEWGGGVHYLFLTGRELEKRALTHESVPFYERSLELSSTDSLRSYLQYHLGILHRKNGNIDAARNAFAQVMLSENANRDLVINAKKFHRALSESKNKERVVIGGVEARTEYKAAYCVPNSLGLILGFFGDPIGARKIGAAITQLELGSYIPDAVSFAEERGFEMVLWPLASLDDIKRCIRKGMPVLAFIPGHVIAIFGYDDAMETLITYDVATYEIWDERDQYSFIQEWNESHNLLAVAFPSKDLNKWKSLLPNHWREKSERYLQYEYAVLSEIPFAWKADHYRASFYPGYFFSNWEWSFATQTPMHLDADLSDAKGVIYSGNLNARDRYFYVQSLYRSGYDSLVLDFVQQMSSKTPLTREERFMLSSSLFRMGSTNIAIRNLIGVQDFPDLPGAVLQTLFDSLPESQLREQVGTQLLQLNPSELVSTEITSEAYRLWRVRLNSLSNEDINENLQKVYRYLLTWNPFDATALADFEKISKIADSVLTNPWEKEIWREKTKRLHANQHPLFPGY